MHIYFVELFKVSNFKSWSGCLAVDTTPDVKTCGVFKSRIQAVFFFIVNYCGVRETHDTTAGLGLTPGGALSKHNMLAEWCVDRVSSVSVLIRWEQIIFYIIRMGEEDWSLHVWADCSFNVSA